MKKNLTLALMLSGLAYSNNIVGSFKSDFELFQNNEGGYSIVYRPIDFKLTNNDDKYTVFVKLRGQRHDITKPDMVDIYDSHYHGPHEHDMSLEDHDHLFDEDIEHNHEHKSLSLYNDTKEKLMKNTDLQLKIGAMYHPVKNSHIRVSYMPFTYDGDERRYYNSLVVDGKYTHLFNDDFAVIVRPQLTTEKFYLPNTLENNLDLRYRLNKDTFLSSNWYSAIQLTNLDKATNFVNSLELTYDYNTENRRSHEFYEVIDHEHEKIDQTKFSLKMEHQRIHFKNNKKRDIFEIKANATYKKTDFIVKDLVFENKAQATKLILSDGSSTATNLFLSNKVKVKYKGLKIENINGINLSNKADHYRLGNDFTIKYAHKLNSLFTIEPSFNYAYTYLSMGLKSIKYNYLVFSTDLSYNQRNAKSRIKVGLRPGYEIHYHDIKNNGADPMSSKMTNFIVTPYAKVKYNITDKLQAFGSAKLTYTFKNKAELIDSKFSLGMKYKW